MFHLVTHAFFKALLFLGAGIVIHALHDEQDIRKMGGLGPLPAVHDRRDVDRRARAGRRARRSRASSRRTPSSPTRSRAATGSATRSGGSASSARFVTALYTFRLMLLVFHGAAERVRAPRTARRTRGTARGRSRCCWTVGVLAVRRARRGPARDPAGHARHARLPRAHGARRRSRRRAHRSSATSALAVALALVGLFAAHVLWGRRSDTPRRIAAATAPVERVLQDKFGFDRLYDWAFYRPAAALARGGQRLWEDAPCSAA